MQWLTSFVVRDPEVAAIMNDPIMNQILQSAQTNPAALQDHMKNPIVKAKINKVSMSCQLILRICADFSIAHCRRCHQNSLNVENS